MERNEATLYCRNKLLEYNLTGWHVRLTMDATKPFLGLCSYKDKCIILNAHHIDLHPAEEVKDTILHEIAHALTPGHGHNSVWANKARELGCTNTLPCSHLSFSPEILDAIRSGAELKIEFEEQVIRTPKYQVTRLQDKCESCGKVAKEVRQHTMPFPEPLPDLKTIYLECGHMRTVKIPKGTPFHKLISFGWRADVKECKHEWNKNQCILCQQYKPYPYQVEGMQFIEKSLSMNKGAAIFDEMGLGKTIQALGYIKEHPESFPVLFIIKSGIKFQWFKEIFRWLGPEYMGQVINTSSDFLVPGMKTYLASYDIFTPKSRTIKGKVITQGMPVEKVLALGIKTVVLDECQQIKNPDSTRTQMIRRIVQKVDHVIPLSGTPWKNRGGEFFTVLNMLAPTRFYSQQAFLDKWVDFYEQGQYTKQGGIRNPEKFKEYISDIAIRRERAEVMPELPEVSRMLQFTEQDKVNQQLYDEEVSDFVKYYNEAVIGGDEDKLAFGGDGPIIARLQRMRHITGLSKIPATKEFVREFIEETDRKLVIFVHHVDVSRILYDDLRAEHKIPILKLEGGMSSEARSQIQEEFNQAPRAILIASTLAAGEGLNLQTCADCILHERQWNPSSEEQAEGRFIRIGQKRNAVNATYMTAGGTVDEFLAGIVERKRAYFHAAMNKGKSIEWKQSDIIKELSEAIVKDWMNKNREKKVS